MNISPIKNILSFDCGWRTLGYVSLQYTADANGYVKDLMGITILSGGVIDVLKDILANVPMATRYVKLQQALSEIQRSITGVDQTATDVYIENQPPNNRDNTDVQAAIAMYFISQGYNVKFVEPAHKLCVYFADELTYSKSLVKHKTHQKAKRAHADDNLMYYLHQTKQLTTVPGGLINSSKLNHCSEAFIQVIAVIAPPTTSFKASRNIIKSSDPYM